MKVLVCGGRNMRLSPERWDLFCRYMDSLEPTVVMHGACRGADRLAATYTNLRGVCEMPFPAKWRARKKAAGPIRNGWMLEHGRPDLVLALPGGDGTADMVRQARAAGVEVRFFA